MGFELKIDPEFEAFCPPLSDEEFTKLHTSVMYYGCIDPIRTWNGTIIDGHNRYKICQKFNIPFTTKEVSDLRTREDVFIWMYNNQMARRNLTDFQRVEFALKVKPHIEERARKRQLEQLRKGNEIPVGENSPQRGTSEKSTTYETEKTAEVIAKKSGVSDNTVKRVEKILKEADPETVEKARSGEISINKAFQTIKAKKEPKPEKHPDGKTEAQLQKEREMLGGQTCDEVMAEGPTLEEIVDDLQRKNSELAEKIASLMQGDKDKEIARLSDLVATLTRQNRTVNERREQMEKQAKWAMDRLRKIGKLVGDPDLRNIVSVVEKALEK